MFITHYDVDGKACLTIGKKFLQKIGKYAICDSSNVDKNINDYLDTIETYNNDDSVLIITDITISKETAMRINNMRDQFSFLLFIDHHPNSNYWLKKYDWCKLYPSNVSSVKAFYDYLTDMGLVLNDDYDEFVNAVHEWDTWTWEDTNNSNAKVVSDLAFNLKTHDFLNRFLMNPSLVLSKKEKLVLGIREEDIQSTLGKIKPIIKGHTAYVFTDKYVEEITAFLFKNNPEIDIVIVINPINHSVSYRSRTEQYDVSELARRNGGNGHSASRSGSPLNKDIMQEVIGLFLADGFKDYTQEEFVANVR